MLSKEDRETWAKSNEQLEAKGGRIINVRTKPDWIVSGYIPPAPVEPPEPVAQKEIKTRKHSRKGAMKR